MTRYFVRTGPRVRGPHTLDELKQLVQRRQLFPYSELSPNGTTWHPADTLDGLFDNAASNTFQVRLQRRPQPGPTPQAGVSPSGTAAAGGAPGGATPPAETPSAPMPSGSTPSGSTPSGSASAASAPSGPMGSGHAASGWAPSGSGSPADYESGRGAAAWAGDRGAASAASAGRPVVKTEAEWLWVRGTLPMGSHDLAGLQQLILERKIQPTDLLWRSGMADWVPAANVPELLSSWQALRASADRSDVAERFSDGAPPIDPLAYVSVACAILGLTLVPVVGSLGAVATGHLALSRIRFSRGRRGGFGMAMTGVVLGWISVGLVVLICLMVVLTTLSRLGSDPPRRTSSHASAAAPWSALRPLFADS